MNSENYLPQGFDLLKTEKAYWKMSEMQEGDNRLRIVMRPIAGWLDWEGRRPHRFRPDQKPKSSFDPEKPVKAFWDCYVWDYAREKLLVLEISQSGVLKTLTAIGEDPEWGNLTSYDIKIKKTGSGKDTKYQVTPLPPKPIAPKILEALAKNPVRLEALYEGKDPWEEASSHSNFSSDSDEMPDWAKEPQPTLLCKDGIAESPFDKLKREIEKGGLDSSKLQEYIANICQKKKTTIDNVVASALLPGLTSRFVGTYVKWLEEATVPAA